MTWKQLAAPRYRVTCDRCGRKELTNTCEPDGWAPVALQPIGRPLELGPVWAGVICPVCVDAAASFMAAVGRVQGAV